MLKAVAGSNPLRSLPIRSHSPPVRPIPTRTPHPATNRPNPPRNHARRRDLRPVPPETAPDRQIPERNGLFRGRRGRNTPRPHGFTWQRTDPRSTAGQITPPTPRDGRETGGWSAHPLAAGLHATLQISSHYIPGADEGSGSIGDPGSTRASCGGGREPAASASDAQSDGVRCNDPRLATTGASCGASRDPRDGRSPLERTPSDGTGGIQCYMPRLGAIQVSSLI